MFNFSKTLKKLIFYLEWLKINLIEKYLEKIDLILIMRYSIEQIIAAITVVMISIIFIDTYQNIDKVKKKKIMLLQKLITLVILWLRLIQ